MAIHSVSTVKTLYIGYNLILEDLIWCSIVTKHSLLTHEHWLICVLYKGGFGTGNYWISVRIELQKVHW